MYTEIAEIYQYAQLVPAMKEIIKYCYTEEDFHVRSNWEELKDLVVDFCKKVAEKDVTLAKEIYGRIAQACSYTTCENSNYILMGDEIQETLPLIYQGMALVGEINVLEDKREFFSTKSGFLSFRNIENQKVYHSTLDPMWEAYELAKRIYNSSFLKYCFLGCGLGYLPWQVFCRSDCSAEIYIFHTEEKYVHQATDYGVLEWISREKLHIIIEHNVQVLIQKFLAMEEVQGKLGKHILEDVLEQLKPEEKNSINFFLAQNHTRTLWGDSLTINAYRNAHHVPKMIGEFQAKTICDEWIVVAAGPSLDDCIEYLRENVGKKTIICASTVLKKLLQNNIRPDGVAVLDPQARTWGHFDNLKDTNTPLLLNVTANWRFGEWYGGDKYLIPSLTDETTVRNYLLQGVESWYIGSTVSTMMLEIAIHLGAKRVEMIGMDLAYPTGRTHATGTMDEKEFSGLGMQQVPSVNGGLVPTTAQFMVYIEEIEQIISDNPVITFYNLSLRGAKIKGTESKRIKENE